MGQLVSIDINHHHHPCYNKFIRLLSYFGTITLLLLFIIHIENVTLLLLFIIHIEDVNNIAFKKITNFLLLDYNLKQVTLIFINIF
jgi:hypothetical protein